MVLEAATPPAVVARCRGRVLVGASRQRALDCALAGRRRLRRGTSSVGLTSIKRRFALPRSPKGAKRAPRRVRSRGTSKAMSRRATAPTPLRTLLRTGRHTRASSSAPTSIRRSGFRCRTRDEFPLPSDAGVALAGAPRPHRAWMARQDPGGTTEPSPLLSWSALAAVELCVRRLPGGEREQRRHGTSDRDRAVLVSGRIRDARGRPPLCGARSAAGRPESGRA